MNQQWYRSWALWLSIAALVVYVLKVVCHIDISETVDGLMNVLLPVLVGFGIVNNPNAKGTLWLVEPSESEGAINNVAD